MYPGRIYMTLKNFSVYILETTSIKYNKDGMYTLALELKSKETSNKIFLLTYVCF